MTARAVKSHPLRAAGALLCLALLFAARAAVALDTVYLVRHAEKSTPWPEESRELDPYWPLSPAGEARAKAWATRLKDAGIAAVYSSRTTRSITTGLPLAQAAGLQVTIDDASTKQDQMAAYLQSVRDRHPNDRAVLLVGHSNTIPHLLVKLGATPDCYARLGISQGASGLGIEGYDGLWRVDLKKQGCEAIVKEPSTSP